MSQPSKAEIMRQMKHHSGEYQRLAQEYRKLDYEDQLREYNEEQARLLNLFRTKYKYYANSSAEEPKEIDWAEIEKLITSGDNMREGYGLCYDSTGTPGLGVSYYGGGAFSPMVEDLDDIRKYEEREEQRREYEKRSKNAKNQAREVQTAEKSQSKVD
jgi:hypothetical protein